MNLDVFYLKKILIKIWRKISISLAELYLLIKILILKLNLLSLYPTRSWISLLCYNRNIITTVPEIEEKKGRKKFLDQPMRKSIQIKEKSPRFLHLATRPTRVQPKTLKNSQVSSKRVFQRSKCPYSR